MHTKVSSPAVYNVYHVAYNVYHTFNVCYYCTLIKSSTMVTVCMFVFVTCGMPMVYKSQDTKNEAREYSEYTRVIRVLR